jgi:hypothetical protein
MKLHTWAYPWDLASIGVDAVLGELRDLGFEGLDLATNYHAITALSPRARNRRVFNSELGAVFFPARFDRYQKVRPQLWPEADVLRVWPQVAERVGKFDLRLHTWTIGMFQPWIAHQCPDCARVLPTGDRVVAGLCPGNVDVQDFFAAMCADAADQFPIELIQIEGSAFPKFTYGWVRPRILIELSPWTEWLLSLCFCDSCCRRARAKGIDVDGLRGRVVAEVERCFEAQGDTDPAGPLTEQRALWLERDPDLRGFLACAEDAVVEFVTRVADAVKGVSTRCKIQIWSPVDVDGSPGVNLKRVLDRIGSVFMWRPTSHPEQAAEVRALTAAAKPRVEITHFQACGWPAFGWPNGVDAPEFRKELEAAIKLGADRVSFYNYGLLRRDQLRRMVTLTRSLLKNTASPTAAPAL